MGTLVRVSIVHEMVAEERSGFLKQHGNGSFVALWRGGGGKSILNNSANIRYVPGVSGPSHPRPQQGLTWRRGRGTSEDLRPAILPSRPRFPSGAWLPWSPWELKEALARSRAES